MELKDKLSCNTQNEIKQYFFNACAKNNLEDVSILLSNNYKLSIEMDDFMAIRTACMFGSLEVLKYLYESDKIKKNINIHAKNDAPFRMATRMGKYDILEYLIFEQNIEETKEIKDYLFKNPNKVVSAMFKARTLNAQLVFDFEHKTNKAKL